MLDTAAKCRSQNGCILPRKAYKVSTSPNESLLGLSSANAHIARWLENNLTWQVLRMFQAFVTIPIVELTTLTYLDKYFISFIREGKYSPAFLPFSSLLTTAPRGHWFLLRVSVNRFPSPHKPRLK